MEETFKRDSQPSISIFSRVVLYLSQHCLVPPLSVPRLEVAEQISCPMPSAVKSGNIFLFMCSTSLFHLPVSAPNSLSPHPSRQKSLCHGDERRIDVSKHVVHITPRPSPDAPNVNPTINMQPHDVCPSSRHPPRPEKSLATSSLCTRRYRRTPRLTANTHTPPSSRSKLGPGYTWGKGGANVRKKRALCHASDAATPTEIPALI